MTINGKERKFLFTVAARIEISRLSKSHDFMEALSLIDGDDDVRKFEALGVAAEAMNRAYERRRAREERMDGREYEPDIMGADEVGDLTMPELSALMDEVVAAMREGQKTEVEAEPVKGKKTEGTAAAP